MAESRTIIIELPPALRALADPTRLKIMLMLEGRPRTVGEIVDFFDFSQPTITRHLQTLLAANLVRREKKGQCVTYATNTENIREVCIELTGCFPSCCCTVEAPKPTKKSSRGKSTPSRKTPARQSKKTTAKKRGQTP
jgi:DNA-binding transcriptional ArsR family regulator